MEFRILRSARQAYGFDEALFGTSGDVVLADPAAARRFALRMVMAGASSPARPVHAGDIDAIGLIHEVMHRAIARSGGSRGSAFVSEAHDLLARDLPSGSTDGTLARFEDAFPSVPVYAGLPSARWLSTSTDGVTNRDIDLEELLLVWVANQNPAFMVYGELYDDASLEGTEYRQIVERLRAYSQQRAATEPRGEDLVEKLLEPSRAAPGSLGGQLRWILTNWPDVIGEDLMARLTLSLDILAEEEYAAKLAWERTAGGGHDAPGAGGLLGASGEDEYEGFSQDREWMPSVVLMAKSTYVWLDQLSRRYGRAIWTLDAIPDEELDRLAEFGVTGLWLIGLWERSHASQRIKQLRGNSEAVASAYSLMDYRIAEDLGGESAWENLRDRAWARRIRLASDMVPNHMGIDSRWVVEHPDWFLQRPEPPYPAYSFNGANLSNDERVGIYLEDHYYDSSDAAVVFKRHDRWSGQERYIYHGNDGTSFPWNDTAQLDYLNPETREAVIQTILAVAKRFPIIRFDAAMTLARRHVQRLWYPLPGQAGAIPSRAESALTQEQFDAAMPHEFWREVVDRVAAEAPDTLLLAEAFWMLEGYFVRTLGMHRVYNSAFMHMLRDEKNADYHAVIRETVDFDPQILKRYVNFMNNPDERTAIDQFGDGDKYFGVATMLATLPGLPMLGHGQVEGFGEKYGMEFRRATLAEQPNPRLVARHEREIFPLLRQRWRFADAEAFRLHGFETTGGDDQNVFAYSNGWGDGCSLVVYHNRYGDTRGFVSGAGERLGVSDEGSRWLILRDHRSGLEFLRNAHDLHARGLELTLNAYECHVFLSFEEVADSPEGEWSRLAWRIGLAGVPDLRAELADQRLQPLVEAAGRYLDSDALRRLAGSALTRDESRASEMAMGLVSDLQERLSDLRGVLDLDAAAARETDAQARLDDLVARAIHAVRAGRAGTGSPDLARHMGTSRRRWSSLAAWVLVDAALRMNSETLHEPARAVDAWGLGRASVAAARGLGLDPADAEEAAVLVRAMVSLDTLPPDGRVVPSEWLRDPTFRAASGWNAYEGEHYVRAEAFAALTEALAERDAILGSTTAFTTAAQLRAAVRAAGYRVGVSATTPQ